MAKKGVPKKDSSGKGRRANRGRGGCKTTKKVGKGRAKAKSPGKGWHGDPVRHRLARYGISTKLPDGKRRLDVSNYVALGLSPAERAHDEIDKAIERERVVERFYDIGREEGVPEDKLRTFFLYYEMRGFPIYHESYVREWAERFASDSEYTRSDSRGKALLRRLNPARYDPKYQDRGAMPDESGGGMRASGEHRPTYKPSDVVAFNVGNRTVVNTAGAATLDKGRLVYVIPARDKDGKLEVYTIPESELRPATFREANESVMHGRHYQ